MDITSAQYLQDNGVNVSIKLISNGKTYFVPLDENNSDYQAIQEWIAEGNTIQEAD
jgi:hypothetical protein